MAKSLEMLVRDSLMNPYFVGYRVCFEPSAVYSIDFRKVLDVTKLTDEQYSSHHVKLFAAHNHLIADPWSPAVVYFIDKDWAVRRSTTSSETHLERGEQVFQIPNSANQRLVPGRCNVCLRFASPDRAVLTDGAGNLYLLDTSDRSHAPKQWKVLLTLQDILGVGEMKLFQVVDATQHSDNENHRVESLVVHVAETEGEEKDRYRSPFLTVVHWITLNSVDLKTWTMERSRRFEGVHPYSYIALDRNGSAVFISSDVPYRLVSDSVKPVQAATEDWEVVGAAFASQPPFYTWNQDDEDIHARFTIPEGITKADLYMNLTADHIEFGVKNSLVLLKGQPHARVNVDASTWSIEGQRIELTLSKEVEDTWPTVVVGDSRGEMTLDATVVAKIHERLAHLTTEQWNPDPDAGMDKPFNCQELEDCDTNFDDNSTMMRIDGETHQVTQKINLGNSKQLFITQLESNKPPAVCLRYDVDGLLWQLEPTVKPGETPMQHVGTFSAFGYVQASKQQRKFSACAPNCSYAVICDCTRHLYIYRQNAPISSPLRNRKTGRQVSTIAKQQVVTLDSVDNIIGLHATNDCIFVVTERRVYAVNVNPEN